MDVKALVEQRMDYFYDLAMSQGLHVSLDLAEKSLHVNKESMIKLIDNLLSNAIKYNKIEGTIELRLTQEYLSVSDKGIGIEEGKIKEILGRYKRANSDKGGFGIGLSIVKSICEKYDVKIEVNSKESVGSEFIYRFKKEEKISS